MCDLRYSVAIRTVGKAGEKYEKEIRSIESQTIPPIHIYVFLADGFARPNQVGTEEYIVTPKGLVHQRAPLFDYQDCDYLLILDDDVFLPKDAVEKMFEILWKNNADCIIPDTFPTQNSTWIQRLIDYCSNNVSARNNDSWAIRIKKSGAFSYNMRPDFGAVYRTESGAGPAFFIKKESFLKIRYDEEYWVDQFPAGTFYEDQLMYYKMYVNGLKMYMMYDSGVLHLDAGTNNQKEKSYEKLMYRSMANYVIWHRSIYTVFAQTMLEKLSFKLAFDYRFFCGLLTRFIFSIVNRSGKYYRAYFEGLKRGKVYSNSDSYRNLSSFIIEN